MQTYQGPHICSPLQLVLGMLFVLGSAHRGGRRASVSRLAEPRLLSKSLAGLRDWVHRAAALRPERRDFSAGRPLTSVSFRIFSHLFGALRGPTVFILTSGFLTVAPWAREHMQISIEQWLMCFVTLAALQFIMVAGNLLKVCSLRDIRDGTLVCLGLMERPTRPTRKRAPKT
jgi:hypothetical protein